MKTIVEQIMNGKAGDVASLVEQALRSKLGKALSEQRRAVASEIYGPASIDEAAAIAAAKVAPGGNRPGTNPVIKPKKSGLQAPEGQKSKDPKQSEQQKRASLQQQVKTQRQKAVKAGQQAATAKGPTASNADKKIAQAKMQAAATKLALLNTKKR
jgi:hypothetical protein